MTPAEVQKAGELPPDAYAEIWRALEDEAERALAGELESRDDAAPELGATG
jgi:hypothetical protein